MQRMKRKGSRECCSAVLAVVAAVFKGTFPLCLVSFFSPTFVLLSASSTRRVRWVRDYLPCYTKCLAGKDRVSGMLSLVLI